MSKFVVDCDRCEFRKPVPEYEAATDLQDNHHIPTGHHPPIKEVQIRGEYIVVCDECSFREPTDSHARAEDLYYGHHTVTGHRPKISG